MQNMKKIGNGRTAEVFEYDDNKIVKLFYKDKPETEALKEYNNLLLANKMNIPSPKVYKTITIDNRFGIVEEKLIGKDGLELLTQSSTPESFVKDMVELQKKLNATLSTECISYKDSLKGSLWSVTSQQEKERLYAKIDMLPDGNNLCHGDFHPGNILVKQDGTQIIIDFVNLCHAPKLFDVARTYFLIAKGELPPELTQEEAEQFCKTREALASLYLNFMQVTEQDLSQFIDVITEVRKYELN